MIVFDCVLLIKWQQGHSFVPLLVKTTLLGSALTLSIPAEPKTQCFVHWNFNSTLQLINGISSYFQKFRHFNGTAIAASFRISSLTFGTGWVSVSPTNLDLYMKDLKAAVFLILALMLVASCLE